MYSACIFCRAGLGRNEVIEHFPIGRRLAFDAAKGRLWVVCRRCERWNLTPLEERWEAVEECERRFRETRLRISTDNIGLARLREGLDLVRIGAPLRPEFAAWRYGDQFGRRRRRAMVQGALGVAIGSGLLIGGAAAGLLVGTAGLATNLAINAFSVIKLKSGMLHLPHPNGGHLVMTPQQHGGVRLVEGKPGAWQLEVPYVALVPEPRAWWRAAFNSTEIGRVRLEGADAMRAAARLLPLINARGATPRRARDAVQLIEDAGGPERYFPSAAASVRRWAVQQYWGDTGAIRHLPHPVRLALEMAAHEETERRALEGELALLEQAWRDAEEIAAIADSL